MDDNMVNIDPVILKDVSTYRQAWPSSGKGLHSLLSSLSPKRLFQKGHGHPCLLWTLNCLLISCLPTYPHILTDVKHFLPLCQAQWISVRPGKTCPRRISCTSGSWWQLTIINGSNSKVGCWRAAKSKGLGDSPRSLSSLHAHDPGLAVIALFTS